MKPAYLRCMSPGLPEGASLCTLLVWPTPSIGHGLAARVTIVDDVATGREHAYLITDPAEVLAVLTGWLRVVADSYRQLSVP